MNRRFAFAALAVACLSVPAWALASAPESPCGTFVPQSAEDGGGGTMPPFDACQAKIRPGALMASPGCTMNWIFQDGTGALYIGTAGHCLGATGAAPRDVGISGLGVIGRSVYNVNAGIGNDFGLVKIDPSKYDLVDPTMCKWGGPSRMAEGSDYAGEHVFAIYGWGFGYGTSQFTRARVLEGTGFSTSLRYTGFTAGGDSGAPIMMSDGSAAGVNTHGLHGVPGVPMSTGLSYAQRLDVAVARAEAALGVDLTLVTSDVPAQVGLGVPFPDAP